MFGSVPSEIAGSAVLCSGTTMGSLAKMREYMSVFLPLLARVPDHLFGYDQALHNHLVYSGLMPDSDSAIRIFPHLEGPVITLGVSLYLPPLNENGLILLPDKSVVNVAHQWTRVFHYDDGSIKSTYGCPLKAVGY
jgi:hypothetical protein